MNYKLIFSVAASLMQARWRQTLVAAIGVTFSITMFICLLGFMSGLNKMLDGLVLNRTPHIHLYNEILPSKVLPIHRSDKFKGYHNFISSVKPKRERLQINDNASIIRALKRDSRVTDVSSKIMAQVIYNVGSIDLTGVINGIDVIAENRMFFFKDYVVSGNYMALKEIPNSIILGKTAADVMLTRIGDIIQVTATNGERLNLKVVGFFQSGLRDIDKVQSYASIETTQKLLGENSGYITDIQMKLKDINSAPQLAKLYASVFDVEAMDIQSANAQYETGSSVRNIISYAVGITLLIVAGFGIYNILNMMIYEKMDSIAILKATGFSGKDVQRIFVSIALCIGLLGGLLGLLFGFGFSLIIDEITFINEAVPTMTTYPVDYNPKYYLIGIVFSLVTTYLAGYFPSRKASKIDPVIIIRGK